MAKSPRKKAPAKPAKAQPRKAAAKKSASAKAAPAPPDSTPRRPAAKPRATSSKPADIAARPAAERQEQPAVLVIGAHPSASLCAMLLKEAKINVLQADIGSTPNADRLATINPAFFKLHKSLDELRKSLNLAPITYARFLGGEGLAAQSQPKNGASRPDVLAYVSSMRELTDALRTMAEDAGVPMIKGPVIVHGSDEHGVHLEIGKRKLSPKVLALADPLPDEAAAVLGVPRFPGRGSNVQATTGLNGGPVLGSKADEQALNLSLDLGGQLQWGWLLRRGDEVQLCVQCPPEADVLALVEEWAQILRRHDVLAPDAQPDPRTLRSSDLPLAGALSRDVVARRTLLLGPAGGFYSASGEDIYPTCWSAKYAAEIAAKAAKADHPQDALGAYRGRWGATLGDYLRGPQQNLRFLLPLVYKNPVMTDRLADAILLGEGLVK